MIYLSRKRALFAGAALILGVNAIVLSGAAYNRSGEPESTLQLSQRELEIPYGWRTEKENSGLALSMRWRVLPAEDRDNAAAAMYDGFYNRNPSWLDAAKLMELGFDAASLAVSPQGKKEYKDYLPREALLVMEMNGPAYQQSLAHARQRNLNAQQLSAANPETREFTARALSASQALTREENENSRLFIIDAGLSTQALRARYPDRARYAIVKGVVRPQPVGANGKQAVTGQIDALLNKQVNVPFELMHAIPQRANSYPAANTKPRYDIELAFGKRLEPWVLAGSGKQ